MSQITSHVLDTSKGVPAKGIELVLYHENGAQTAELARDTTNSDGRSVALLDDGRILDAGSYRIRFFLESYLGEECFYPYADITFRVSGSGEHYHIPLLLSPFGFTTYRGS